MVDTLPAGLTATAITGSGWTCTLATLTCTSTTVEAAAASFPVITLTVNVAANAASSIINTAVVSGGGETNTSNDTANDSTIVTAVTPAAPDLTITKTHAGNFIQGQIGATYSITAVNAGTGPTAGTVTVVDTLPSGLTATAMTGSGWTCTVATLTCTSTTVEAAGMSFPVITLTVNVAPNAVSGINSATVSGGGETNLNNDTANDPTTIDPAVQPSALSDIFQVRYAANLNIGDSFIDITNTGASGGANLCANLYTFDPAEELISCCTCSVTPNGLQSLSVLKSLISNPLTPAIPTAVVVKMVATTGACNASVVNPANLAHGLAAWGTTLHQNTSAAASSYSVSETSFSKADLSPAELAHITSTCGFIQSNGSGFGICKGCAASGLGATSAQ